MPFLRTATMASDFFEQQHVARKKTGRLILLMVLAMVGIVLVTYPIIAIALMFITGAGSESQSVQGQPTQGLGFWNIEVFALVTIGTLAVTTLSSLYKVAALKSGGGGMVASSLGGVPVDPDTRDPQARKLLNVVEEMAIASGIPVPPVYLLEQERGINAFAAGYKPDDAVIGVTRGAIEQLSRDELQGVIAHEFSHILNGDMRLNIRLMGIIFGILVLGVLGRIALRVAFYSGGGRGKKNGQAMAVMIVVGLLLIIIGAIGVFFGKLIKAAVSRQREFLADASAVQFTRNPDGIAGALKRLAAHSHGARIENPHAEESAHMFFGSAVSSWLGGAMATHPPLPMRIKRIDPSWDGSLPDPSQPTPRRGTKQAKGKPGQGADGIDLIPGTQGIPGMPGGMLGSVVTGAVIADAADGASPRGAAASGTALDSVGQLDDAHIAYARELIGSIPGPLREAARQPFGARAVVFVVLLDEDASVRAKQLSHLEQHAEGPVAKLSQSLAHSVAQLPREARLSLVDLCLPALQTMSPKQYEVFKRNLDVLIEADERVDLFEWTLRRLLTRHLEAHLFRPSDPKVHYYALKPVAEHCAVLLSTLARVGSKDEDEVRRAYEAGVGVLGLDGVGLVPREGCRLSVVGDGFDELSKLSPREKKKLLRGCAVVIAADGEITLGEGELMRAVADSLDCPMPPLLPGQKLV
ncbi:MAG: M48 family metallopeptidase [Phycisphaerales bacterium JB063]